MLFHVALDGATPDNEHWIRAKQRTAARYEVPSLLVGLRGRLHGGRIEDHGWFDETTLRRRTAAHSRFTWPAWARWPPSPSRDCRRQQDHDLVVEALREILGSMRAE